MKCIFAGESDRVRCFYCGLAMTNWLPDDEPWAAHEFYNPECDYLAMVKNTVPRDSGTVRATSTEEGAGEGALTETQNVYTMFHCLLILCKVT